MRQGASDMVDPERIPGRYCLYRSHTESPITFEKSIRVTAEHVHRSDNFYSTAYWYQIEPHTGFPAPPRPAQARGTCPKNIASRWIGVRRQSRGAKKVGQMGIERRDWTLKRRDQSRVCS